MKKVFRFKNGKTFDQHAKKSSIYAGTGKRNYAWRKFGGKWFDRDNFSYSKRNLGARLESLRRSGKKFRTVTKGKWTTVYTRPKNATLKEIKKR